MFRLAVLLLASLGVSLVASTAGAAERRVALIQGDAELFRALSLALSAWGVDTIESEVAQPQSSQPEAVLEAGALARRLSVDGVVWVAVSDQGTVLWVYDARTHQATTRVLPVSPPFDSAAAAGVALSVKTALRASVEPSASPRAALPQAPEPSRPERASLEAGLDAHFLDGQRQQARLSLSSVVWLTLRRRFGLGLSVAGGLGTDVATSTFDGRYREFAFGPSAHFRWLTGETFGGTWFVGAAGHAALLDGTVTRTGERSAVKRYNASLKAGAQLNMQLGGGLYLGLSAQGTYLLGYQRYLVDGQPVFAPWRLSASVGGQVGIAFL